MLTVMRVNMESLVQRRAHTYLCFRKILIIKYGVERRVCVVVFDLASDQSGSCGYAYPRSVKPSTIGGPHHQCSLQRLRFQQ